MKRVVYRPLSSSTAPRSESSPESSRRLVKSAVQAASRRRSWRRVRQGRLVTAADLAAVVAAAAPSRPGGADAGRIHPATRTFQALRIAVNREVEVLIGRPGRRAGRPASRRPDGRHQLPQPRGPHRQAVRRAREPRLHRGAAAAGLHLRPPRAAARGHQGRHHRGPRGGPAEPPRAQRKAARRREARRRTAECRRVNR